MEGGSWAFYSLIKFDLSSIPSDADIITAKLWCYFSGWYDNNPAGNSAVLYRLLGDWDEGTVTWNNQPSASSSSSASCTIPSSTGVWMQWTVTNDVQNFVDGTNNYGWRMMDTTYWPGVNIPTSYFHSKEGGNTPRLEVEYIANQPPNKPSRPSGPSSLEVGKQGTFSTVATDPDGDSIKYGWDWNGDNTVDQWTEYFESGFEVNTNHSWDEPGVFNLKVIAEDDEGGQSNFSSFLTVLVNDPPKIPTINGKLKGNPGTSYSYSIITTDPNDDRLYYMIDWDDGNITDWKGTYNSGETVNISHVWSNKGTYFIKVKAKDIHGAESDWSSFEVKMPKSRSTNPLYQLLMRLLDLFPILQNLLNL